MIDTIKDTAKQWKSNNPTNHNEIIEHIIDNINIQETLIQNRNLKREIEMAT